jgi:hypothetical protein
VLGKRNAIGHVNHAVDQFGLGDMGRGAVTPLELGARQAVPKL